MAKKKSEVTRINDKGQVEVAMSDHEGLWYNPKLKVKANRKARKRNRR